ncbi:MAG: bacillithiol biosynthesis cysteine-adding enzyme BshC [Vicinamibacterales bacterium]
MQSEAPSPASAALPVDIRKFPWIRRLASDYAFAYERVAPFFAGNPSEPAAWADVIARTQAHLRAPAEMASVLAAQQERRGAPPEARAMAARLSDPQSVVVITGQQAGVFGGPLFTLLKALTAMKLAEDVSRRHGVTAVPVFWIDAEDHDWPEVSGCTVLDHELEPRTITLPDLPGAGHLPIARLALDAGVTGALDALEAALPETEFRASVLLGLRAAYQPGVGMAEAFGRWIETVLGPRGLVVFDSSDPAAKPLVQDVFAREISNPGSTARLAAEAGHELVARGYHSQVTPADGAVSLFYLNEGREGVRYAGETATVGDRQLSLRALAEDARRAPQHFSPNVLLRPIVQDTLFPTVCYVAGPNELAYLGQLRHVYDHFGLPMPLMYQRATATLADSATLRFLTKYDLPLVALQPRDEAALNQLLQDQLPPSVEQALTAAAAEIEARMGEVARQVPQIDPTLEGATQSTLGRMQRDLGSLHNKVIQAAKRRDETLRRQFVRARALTFPNGHPQERELGFVWFLNRYGPALIDRLLEELPLEMGHHWVLTI